jgi:hypothetical protein
MKEAAQDGIFPLRRLCHVIMESVLPMKLVGA